MQGSGTGAGRTGADLARALVNHRDAVGLVEHPPGVGRHHHAHLPRSHAPQDRVLPHVPERERERETERRFTIAVQETAGNEGLWLASSY